MIKLLTKNILLCAACLEILIPNNMIHATGNTLTLEEKQRQTIADQFLRTLSPTTTETSILDAFDAYWKAFGKRGLMKVPGLSLAGKGSTEESGISKSILDVILTAEISEECACLLIEKISTYMSEEGRESEKFSEREKEDFLLAENYFHIPILFSLIINTTRNSKTKLLQSFLKLLHSNLTEEQLLRYLTQKHQYHKKKAPISALDFSEFLYEIKKSKN